MTKQIRSYHITQGDLSEDRKKEVRNGFDISRQIVLHAYRLTATSQAPVKLQCIHWACAWASSLHQEPLVWQHFPPPWLSALLYVRPMAAG